MYQDIFNQTSEKFKKLKQDNHHLKFSKNENFKNLSYPFIFKEKSEVLLS
jgi:hypothetical protein